MGLFMRQSGTWAIATTAATVLITGLNFPVFADSVVPATDGTGTQVMQSGSDYAITGGTTSADAQNLFHSFQEFTLLTGESATFLTDPTILNVLGRVSGGNASFIDGLLQVSGSDANLFLINPNGILLGPNSALNLQGGFTATTADQINFATGEWGSVGTPDYTNLVGTPESFRFTWENPGGVVNSGRLTVDPGQSVVLMGGQVLSTGTIAAPGGNIIISAVEGGSLVRIEQAGSLLNLEMVTLPETAEPTLGAFTPLSLPELLTGSAIASATQVTVNPDGTITLVGSDIAVPTETGTAIANGTLTASSTHQGGNVTVLGTSIGLISAVVEASGERGGGVIRIGGDYQGQGILPTATVTFVDETSVLAADAIADGDGGQIIIWSEETTRSYGTLGATGGIDSGNGGLVETSSRGFLETTGIPDTSAPQGTAGTWLLDPFDIEIVDEFVDSEDSFPSGNPFVAEAGTPARLDWRDIQAALESNATVTVSTGIDGDGNGDITIVDGFALNVTNADSTLQLLAAGDIDSPFGITNEGAPVNFEFIADTDSDGSGQIRIGNPFISNGGDITLQGADAGAAPGIVVNGTIESNGGDVVLQSGNADIVLQSINAEGGAVTIETPRLIRILGAPSVETLDGAAIQLVHGGNGNVPFVVGDARQNGTAGAVTNGVDELPEGAYFDTVSVGSIASSTGSSETTDEFDCVGGCEEPQPAENFDNDDFGSGEDTGNDPAFQDETGGDVGFQEDGFRDDMGGDRNNAPDGGLDEAGPDNGEPGNGDFREEGAGDNRFQEDRGSDNDFGENGGDNDEGDRSLDNTEFDGDDFQEEEGGDSEDRIDNDFREEDPTEDEFREEDRNRDRTDDDFQDDDRGDDGFREDEEAGERDQQEENRDQAGGEDEDATRDEDAFDDEGDRPDRPNQGPGDDFNDLTNEEWAFEDSFYADDFVNYFNLPAMSAPDVQSSQNTLRALSQQVGTSPGIVYARFVPAGNVSAQQAGTKQLQNPQPTDVLQLVLVTPDGQPRQVVVPDANREAVIAATRQLHREVTDRTRRRLTTYLAPSQQLYNWLIRPLETMLEAEGIGHLSFIMAPGLRSLPLAALHDGEQFIIENYTVGLMPSLALTDTRYTDLRDLPVLAMGASQFVDQPDLPAVPFELNTIVGSLRLGEQTLNETFTPRALVALREASDYRILHLATHGEFRAGGPDNSYIQFWDQRLRLDQLRQLQLNDPPLELLVMSACRTALGDPSAELGFAGLAVQAGVKSAVATLWQVSDLETAGLMTEFYTQLSQRAYKAEALRQAQLAMLRGEVTVQDGTLRWSGGSLPLPEELANLRYGNTRHPYYWAAFTMVGSPW